MKRLLLPLLALCLVLPLMAAEPPCPAPVKAAKKFKTGAKRTPQHRVLAAIDAGKLRVHKVAGTTPAQFAMVPKQMSYWLNDQEGDCVSAEEAAAVAAYSTICGTEYFVKDATVQTFCTKYGTCDGADLLSVLQQMQSDGFHQGGDTITVGAASVVDYSNEANLQNALSQGPVKIGIDSSALPSGAGNDQGWGAFGGRPQQFGNEDHCVSLFGYGSVQWLSQQLGVAVPSGAPANGYLLYTWSTIGIVDHAWIMSTCGEAYLRSPTTILNGKPLVPGPVPPGPTPIPGNVTITLTPDQVASVLQQAGGGQITLTPEEIAALKSILERVPQKKMKPETRVPVLGDRYTQLDIPLRK